MKAVLVMCVFTLMCFSQTESTVMDVLQQFLSTRGQDKRACEFQCADGSKCLKSRQMCNNYKDCEDGSDEDVEKCKKEKLCLFTCGLYNNPSRQMCVKPHHLCDSRPLCDSRVDEEPETCEKYDRCLHLCEDRRSHQTVCLKKSKICNRQPDCLDKSDEKHEACVKVSKTYRECELLCPGESEYLCVRPDRICDGTADCRESGADELKQNCYMRKPRSLGILEELLNEVETDAEEE